MSDTFFIIGGAGFIGSHFIDRLLASDRVRRVTVYDNFTSGQAWHYEEHLRDRRLRAQIRLRLRGIGASDRGRDQNGQSERRKRRQPPQRVCLPKHGSGPYHSP